MRAVRPVYIAALLIAFLAVASILVAEAALASRVADQGVDGLRSAIALTTGDSTLHEELALVQARTAAAADELRSSLDHAVKALQLRPVSPYGWAVLAEVKYRADVADATFERALQRAAALGPYEPEVQRSVAYYGLAIWDQAAPETRAAVERMLTTGIKADAPAMMQIAQRRGRLAIACRHVDGTSRIPANWAQLCKQMGEK